MNANDDIGAASRALTEGEICVGVGYTPSGNADIDDVKRMGAALIDKALAQSATGWPGARSASIAATEIEAACMWLVKAIARNSAS